MSSRHAPANPASLDKEDLLNEVALRLFLNFVSDLVGIWGDIFAVHLHLDPIIGGIAPSIHDVLAFVGLPIVEIFLDESDR